MDIRIIRKNQQARGQFNGGEILENKPIGFPREGGVLKPYSNLFYWAHAWSDRGSTIGLHPHQGFEIMSFVLEGSIAHFDTAGNVWKTLEKGAAQIIRSGNGISHSEKLNPGARMFQIWLDPNLEETLNQPASYNDYPDQVFPLEQMKGMTIKTYKGKGSPLQMDSPDVEILQINLNQGSHELSLNSNQIHSFYLIEGGLKLEEANEIGKDDFFILKNESKLIVEASRTSSLFVLSSPLKLSYKTYGERMQA